MLLESRKIVLDYIPDYRQIGAEIFMYQSIAHTFDECPGNICIIIFDIIRELANGFPNYLNVIQASLNNHEV